MPAFTRLKEPDMVRPCRSWIGFWGSPYKMELYPSLPDRGKPVQAGFDEGRIVFFFQPSGEMDSPPGDGVTVLSIQRAWEEALSF